MCTYVARFSQVAMRWNNDTANLAQRKKTTPLAVLVLAVYLLWLDPRIEPQYANMPLDSNIAFPTLSWRRDTE
ncbi:hypothetical protein BJX64DRAFT_260009 [Aspergillus heterothallicus]